MAVQQDTAAMRSEMEEMRALLKSAQQDAAAMRSEFRASRQRDRRVFGAILLLLCMYVLRGQSQPTASNTVGTSTPSLPSMTSQQPTHTTASNTVDSSTPSLPSMNSQQPTNTITIEGTRNSLPSAPNPLTSQQPASKATARYCGRVHDHRKPTSGRLVYMDLGANWANTLRLFMDIGCYGPSENWEIYSFEASPVISPYVADMTQWLNHGGPKPTIDIPTAGSSFDLIDRFAAKYGCHRRRRLRGQVAAEEVEEKGVEVEEEERVEVEQKVAPIRGRRLAGRQRKFMCVYEQVREEMERLKRNVNQTLNSSEYIQAQLAHAQTPNARSSPPRYSFIPAAVGGEDGWLTFSLGPLSLLRGGTSLASEEDQAQIKASEEQGAMYYRVRVVNLVDWLVTNFKEEDWVIVKMDVEGAEHSFLPKLLQMGKAGIIDILAWECHGLQGEAASRGEGPSCKKLRRDMEAAGTTVIDEGPDYKGFDTASQKELDAMDVMPRRRRPR